MAAMQATSRMAAVLQNRWAPVCYTEMLMKPLVVRASEIMRTRVARSAGGSVCAIYLAIYSPRPFCRCVPR